MATGDVVMMSRSKTDEEIAKFRETLAKLKDDLIVQVGKLEFAESDARIRLKQVQLQQEETKVLAAMVKRFDIELETFVT